MQPRPDPRPRQVRIQITGGIGDITAWAEDLHAIAKKKGFTINFEDGPKRFGEHGPLHKIVVGYAEIK